jgi:hypothetical protein
MSVRRGMATALVRQAQTVAALSVEPQVVVTADNPDCCHRAWRSPSHEPGLRSACTVCPYLPDV